jgi:outer membrane receptor protein involved in Fe transport
MTFFLRFLLLFALVLLAAGPAEATEGRVTDKRTGAPVAGAEVTIVGLPGSVRTDTDGKFSWKPDLRPPFVVLVVLPGGRVGRSIEVTKLAGTLELAVEAAVTEELTVAAGVAPSIETSLGSAMTMLAKTDLAQRGVANLMQAVENVPGVNQVSEGQAAVPAVRGLARGRTLILIDGSRVTTERRVGPSATFMDPSIVEGVDIARGPGSVAYGSDAFGGVISVRTKRPGFTGWTADGSMTIGAGIPDRRAEGSFSRGFGVGGVIASGHYRKAEDYDGPEGSILNSGWADHGALVRMERRAGTGLFSASWQGDFGRDIERPRNNSNSVRFSYPFENSHRMSAGYDRAGVGALDMLRLSVFLGTIDQRTDQDRIPTATRPRDIVRADIRARDFQVRATAQKLFDDTRVEFGADVNGRYGLEAHDVLIQYDLAGGIVSTVDNLSVDSARRVDTGLFFEVDSPVANRVTASGGVRVDRVSNVNRGGYFGDRSISNGAGAGYAAVAVGPISNLTFTAQVSRGFRDPTLSDRFFRGPSGRGFITGNPDLDPETSLQADFGVRYAGGRLSAAVYGYTYRIRNLVERFSPDTDFFEFRNRGRARIRGVEAELQADLTHGVSTQIAAQIGRGTTLDDETRLDDISTDQWSIQVRQAVGERLSAFARLAFYADDDRPGPSEVPAPGHTNLDVGATWAIHRRLVIRGSIRNVLDETYYASPDPRFVLAPGVNGFVTVRIRY